MQEAHVNCRITGGNAERGVSMTIRLYVRQRTDDPELKGG
jgi:hypothetical protein